MDIFFSIFGFISEKFALLKMLEIVLYARDKR